MLKRQMNLKNVSGLREHVVHYQHEEALLVQGTLWFPIGGI